jgi:hypothetical protein
VSLALPRIEVGLERRPDHPNRRRRGPVYCYRFSPLLCRSRPGSLFEQRNSPGQRATAQRHRGQQKHVSIFFPDPHGSTTADALDRFRLTMPGSLPKLPAGRDQDMARTNLQRQIFKTTDRGRLTAAQIEVGSKPPISASATWSTLPTALSAQPARSSRWARRPPSLKRRPRRWPSAFHGQDAGERQQPAGWHKLRRHGAPASS